jgi:hypothetical protein
MYKLHWQLFCSLTWLIATYFVMYISIRKYFGIFVNSYYLQCNYMYRIRNENVVNFLSLSQQNNIHNTEAGISKYIFCQRESAVWRPKNKRVWQVLCNKEVGIFRTGPFKTNGFHQWFSTCCQTHFFQTTGFAWECLGRLIKHRKSEKVSFFLRNLLPLCEAVVTFCAQIYVFHKLDCKRTVLNRKSTEKCFTFYFTKFSQLRMYVHM